MQDDILASRKFIDLIYQASSKWANWDPPVEIKVGDYGTIARKTGELEVEGNIYAKEFQTLLDNQGLKIDLSDPACQPQESEIGDNLIISSLGVKKMDLLVRPEASFLNLAFTSVKFEFQFPEGKRGAVLVMYKPREKCIPPGKAATLVDKAIGLQDKYLVTSTFTCPGYCIYLSNKSGERIALALTKSLPIPAAAGLTTDGTASIDWWTDTQAALLRKAIAKNGQYLYTPLYTLKRRQGSWMSRVLSTRGMKQ